MPALLDRIATAVPVKDISLSSIGLSGSWAQPSAVTASSAVRLTSGHISERETIGHSFEEYVEQALKKNGIVWACTVARMLPFSEVRFAYQEMVNGFRPGRLTGGAGLELLNRPWVNGTTGDLLARMELDASFGGNFYGTPVGTGTNRRLRRLRPDWMTVVSGIRDDAGDIDMDASAWDLNAEVLGYIYEPKGITTRKRPTPVILLPEQVVHYAPIPDPIAQWRGMSWITPLVREINADGLATAHKEAFFKKGASLNVVVRYDKAIKPEQFERYVELFDQQHAGPANAYKTLHLGGGADATVVGTNLKELDFKATQGAGETRIAAAAGVGAIIARLSEGLSGSALNQGNYAAAKRQFGDMTLRPLWRNAAGSLEKLTRPATDQRLTYDASDVEFLKEDRKDAAEILSSQAQTIKALTDAGFEPNAVIDAVEAGDLSRLAGKHTGLFSVQLMPTGGNTP